MNPTRFTCLLLLSCVLAGCGGPSEDSLAASAKSTAPSDDALSLEDAMTVFTMRCMTCHGTVGKGDGPGAAACNPKPRAFSDVAWQDGISDEQIKKTIVYGGAAVGKSPIMPAQPDLKSDPKTLNGLVKVVRSWRGK